MASSVVSADSHVLEPADLWTTRLDNRFRDRAPRVVQTGPDLATRSSLRVFAPSPSLQVGVWERAARSWRSN